MEPGFSPTFTTTTTPVDYSGAFFIDPIGQTIWITGIALGGLVLLVFAVRWLFHRSNRIPAQFQQVVLLITLPKESIQQEESGKKDMKSQQTMTEQVGLAEIFFNSIGGLKAERGVKAWFFGRHDHFGLEIVACQGKISFYLAVPRKLQRYIEQQVNAHYPEAFIEETEDYNIFQPQGIIAAGVITAKREFYFPIKTYKKMENDPLEALTNALSKLTENEGAAIQYIVRSAHGRWHWHGSKVASVMKQGKKLGEAKREASPNLIIRWWAAVLKLAAKKKTDPAQPKVNYQLSAMEEEMLKGIEEKVSKAGLDVNIRVVVSTDQASKAQIYVGNILNAFAQFNIYQYGNSFQTTVPRRVDGVVSDFIHRSFVEQQKMLLNTEELASVFHFPSPTIDTPNIHWLTARQASAPLNVPTDGLRLGTNFYRGKETVIHITRADRRRHVYVVGKSGVGKSWLLANMARQDIANGEGICVIDPHGDLVDDVLEAVPKERADDVILFDPADVERPMGLNLLEFDPRYPEQKTFVINEMIKIFDKLYDLRSTGGPMFEQYMRNAMLLIMEDPESGSTLMEISKVLADPEYRKYKLERCVTPVVKDFWTKEAEKAGGEASLQNMVPYITSKLNTFISNDFMRPIIGQQTSAINFRDAMDTGKILLVKLSKGRLGDLNTNLLGMMMVGKILMAALSRTDTPKETRRDFYLYIDEFQNFTTDSIAVILSEARKYMLNLIIAHQYIGQLVHNNDTTIRDAVFGNVGTIISFKIGVEDAEVLAKEFAPVFNQYDVINIEKYTAYVKLLVNNEATKAFNMKTDQLAPGNRELAAKLHELSRLKYGRDRALVEREIIERTQSGSIKPPV